MGGTSFCDSPNHLSWRVDRLMLRNTALVSRAMACGRARAGARTLALSRALPRRAPHPFRARARRRLGPGGHGGMQAAIAQRPTLCSDGTGPVAASRAPRHTLASMVLPVPGGP